MKARYAVALALLAGFGMGVAAIQTEQPDDDSD